MYLSVSIALNSALNIVIWAGVRLNATASNISFLNRESRINLPRELICKQERRGERGIEKERSREIGKKMRLIIGIDSCRQVKFRQTHR